MSPNQSPGKRQADMLLVPGNHKHQRHATKPESYDEQVTYATVNTDIVSALEDSIATLLDCPHFETIQDNGPTCNEFDKFSEDRLNDAMPDGSSGSYEFIDNLWSHDIRFLIQHGVPVNQHGVEQIKRYLFSSPPTWQDLKGQFAITVAGCEGLDLKRSRARWKRVSAPELVHALPAAVASAIKGGADEPTLDAWLDVMRNIAYTVKQCNPTDMFTTSIHNPVAPTSFACVFTAVKTTSPPPHASA